jgi:hypothetical protein
MFSSVHGLVVKKWNGTYKIFYILTDTFEEHRKQLKLFKWLLYKSVSPARLGPWKGKMALHSCRLLHSPPLWESPIDWVVSKWFWTGIVIRSEQLNNHWPLAKTRPRLQEWLWVLIQACVFETKKMCTQGRQVMALSFKSSFRRTFSLLLYWTGFTLQFHKLWHLVLFSPRVDSSLLFTKEAMLLICYCTLKLRSSPHMQVKSSHGLSQNILSTWAA